MYDIGQQMLTLIFTDKQSFQEDSQSDYGAYAFTEIDISPEKDKSAKLAESIQTNWNRDKNKAAIQRMRRFHMIHHTSDENRIKHTMRCTQNHGLLPREISESPPDLV